MNGLIAIALRQRALMIVLMLAVFVGGAIAFTKLNIEAYPDPVPPLVDIIAQSPGHSAEEIERYITIPVEIQMAGIPNVTAIRTISLFGLSDIKVQFTYDFTYEQAEQWVINRLSQLSPLPNGATAADLPGEPDRRDHALSRGRTARLFRDRSQDDRGLDAGAPLQGGSGRRSTSTAGAARPRPTRSRSTRTSCSTTA